MSQSQPPHRTSHAEPQPHSPAPELEREFELERMILFSDAIFAIAITLMVIDVKWPEMPESLKGVDLQKLLHPTFVEFIIFVISFVFVGRAWKTHLRLFRQLRQYDQVLLNFNLLYLFFIVIFPFTATGLLGHVRDGFPYPFLLYIADMAGVGISDWLITRYIFQIKTQLTAQGQTEEKKFILIRARHNAIAISLVFCLMLLVAFRYPNNTDYLADAFCLYPFAIILANRRTRRLKKPDMETERTRLTLLMESDLPAMTAMSKEPDTFRFIKKLRIMTDKEYQRFLKLKLRQIRTKTGYHWAVWLKSDGSFVGAVNLNPIAGSSRMQIGCQLMRQYWGQGLASELTERVVEFAVDKAGLKEVYGVFEKDNLASRRLLDKLGFVWIGDLNENDVEAEVHRYVPPAPT